MPAVARTRIPSPFQRRLPSATVAGAALAAVVLLWPSTGDAELRRWAPVSGQSHVSFSASFPLGDFTGRGEDLDGEFQGDPSDLRQGITGVLRVTVARLKTGVDGRDRDMWKALEAERFPKMQFTVENVEPSFNSVTDKTDVLLTIRGRLQVRDVEHPLTFLGRVRIRDGHLWVRGEANLRMTEFGIVPPKKLFLTVRDQVLVGFDLTLATAP